MKKYVAIHQEGDSFDFSPYDMSILGITSTFEDAVNKIKERFLAFGYSEKDFEDAGIVDALETNSLWIDKEGENDKYIILSYEE